MGTHGSDDQFDIPMGEAPNRDRHRTSASTPRRPCPGLTGPSRPRSQSPPLSRPKPQLYTRPEGEPAAAPVASVTCRRGELRHHAGAEPPDRERGQEAHRPLNAETPKPGRDHAGDLNRLTLRTATSSRSPERRAANGRPGPGRARRRDPDPGHRAGQGPPAAVNALTGRHLEQLRGRPFCSTLVYGRAAYRLGRPPRSPGNGVPGGAGSSRRGQPRKRSGSPPRDAARRWPEAAASRPGDAVWIERGERASAKAGT